MIQPSLSICKRNTMNFLSSIEACSSLSVRYGRRLFHTNARAKIEILHSMVDSTINYRHLIESFERIGNGIVLTACMSL